MGKSIKSQMMKAAWDMARKAAAKFGGKASQYFAQTLKEIWAKMKKTCFVRSENVSDKAEFLKETKAVKAFSNGKTGFGGYDLSMYDFYKAGTLGLLKSKRDWV